MIRCRVVGCWQLQKHLVLSFALLMIQLFAASERKFEGENRLKETVKKSVVNYDFV